MKVLLAAKQNTVQKTLKVLFSVLSVVIIAAAVFLFAETMIARSQNREVRIFGYSYHIVVTGSMDPTIKVGEFVTVKHTEIAKVKKDDIVMFRSVDSASAVYGQLVIHRVKEVLSSDTNGVIRLITKGDNESATIDPFPVTEDNFVGIMTGKSVFIGSLILFFENPSNWIFILFILAFLYYAYYLTIKILNGLKSVKSEKSEKENMLRVAKELGIEIRRETDTKTTTQEHNSESPRDDK